MRDVRGGQAQRLYLAQLSVHRLRGDQLSQVVEGAVHALRPAALPLVGGGGDRRRLLCNGRQWVMVVVALDRLQLESVTPFVTLPNLFIVFLCVTSQKKPFSDNPIHLPKDIPCLSS